MYRVARIQAYDVMTEIVITAQVKTYDDLATDAPPAEIYWQTTVDGVGEEDPSEWLRDALVGLLEAL